MTNFVPASIEEAQIWLEQRLEQPKPFQIRGNQTRTAELFFCFRAFRVLFTRSNRSHTVLSHRLRCGFFLFPSFSLLVSRTRIFILIGSSCKHRSAEARKHVELFQATERHERKKLDAQLEGVIHTARNLGQIAAYFLQTGAMAEAADFYSQAKAIFDTLLGPEMRSTGEVMGIVGESGSGKSTIISLLHVFIT